MVNAFFTAPLLRVPAKRISTILNSAQLETRKMAKEGILAFAERILPRAADLWVQASLDYRQRLQELFFPEGIAHDGIRFNRTAVTASLFRYLEPDQRAQSNLASPTGFEPVFQP